LGGFGSGLGGSGLSQGSSFLPRCLAVACFGTFFATVFFATALFAETFFVATFFVAAFFVATFIGLADFFTTLFFAVGSFINATSNEWIVMSFAPCADHCLPWVAW